MRLTQYFRRLPQRWLGLPLSLILGQVAMVAVLYLTLFRHSGSMPLLPGSVSWGAAQSLDEIDSNGPALDRLVASASVRAIAYRRALDREALRLSKIVSRESCGAEGGDMQSYRSCGDIHYCCGTCGGFKLCYPSPDVRLESCACILPHAPPLWTPTRAGTCRNGVSNGAKASPLTTPLYTITPRHHLTCSAVAAVEPNTSQTVDGYYHGDATSSTIPTQGELAVLVGRISLADEPTDVAYSNLMFTMRRFGYGPLVIVERGLLQHADGAHGVHRTGVDLRTALLAVPPDGVVMLLDALADSLSKSTALSTNALFLGPAAELRQRFLDNRQCKGQQQCRIMIAARSSCPPAAQPCLSHDSISSSSAAPSSHRYIEPAGMIGYASAVLSLLECATAAQATHWRKIHGVHAIGTCLNQEQVGLDHHSDLFASVANATAPFEADWEWEEPSQTHGPRLRRKQQSAQNNHPPLVALLRDYDLDAPVNPHGSRPLCPAFHATIYNRLGEAAMHHGAATTSTMSTTRLVVVMPVLATDDNAVEAASRLALSLLRDQTRPPDMVYLSLRSPTTTSKVKASVSIPNTVRNHKRVTVVDNGVGAGTGTESTTTAFSAAFLTQPLARESDGDTLMVVMETGATYDPSFLATLLAEHAQAPHVALGYAGAMVDMQSCLGRRTWGPSPHPEDDVLDVSTVSVRSASEWQDGHAPVDILAWRGSIAFARRSVDVARLGASRPSHCSGSLDVWLSAHLALQGVPRVQLPLAFAPVKLGDAGFTYHEHLDDNGVSLDACATTFVDMFMMSRTSTPRVCPIRFQAMGGVRTYTRGMGLSLTTALAVVTSNKEPLPVCASPTRLLASQKSRTQNQLRTAEFMIEGDTLTSPDGKFTAIMTPKRGICMTASHDPSSLLWCFPPMPTTPYNVIRVPSGHVRLDMQPDRKVCVFSGVHVLGQPQSVVLMGCTKQFTIPPHVAAHPDVTLGVTNTGALRVTATGNITLWHMDAHEARVDARQRYLLSWDNQVCRAVMPWTPCHAVDARQIDMSSCRAMKDAPLTGDGDAGSEGTCVSTRVNPKPRNVPKVLHAIHRHNTPPAAVRSNSASNKDYRLNYLNYSAGHVYVTSHCGALAGKAYAQANFELMSLIFRFCAIMSEGGVFVDAQLHLMKRIDHVYDTCAPATFGYLAPDHLDTPWRVGDGRRFALTAKMVAGTKGSTVHKCVLAELVNGPPDALNTGGAGAESLLTQYLDGCVQQCVNRTGEGSKGTTTATGNDKDECAVAVTYRSTTYAGWPYTGMVGHVNNRTTLLAFEEPTPAAFGYKRRPYGKKLS
eukprot:m.93798 g.93798  ORF g.93798 m.93798 type:complete len:1313 (-) comp10017_c0_seq1:2182-6120(-)